MMGDCENSQVVTPLAAQDRAGKRRLALILSVLVVLVISTFLAHECRGAMEAWRRADCSSNPKMFGIVCKMFANDNEEHLYPRLSSKPGQLMVEREQVYPKYVTNPWLVACPSVHIPKGIRNHPEALIDDRCFLYLGYAVSNDDEVAAFATAYKEHMAEGLPFDKDLQVPSGQGNGLGNVLYRLREGVQRFFITDINKVGSAHQPGSSIPVLIERPENHRSEGGNVLFMDGHVEFMRYPGQWPMTEQTINALKELDAMGK
jgi:prepilin-type processing-associated H-X9-DG protein